MFKSIFCKKENWILLERLKNEAIKLNDDDFVKLMSDEDEESLLKNYCVQDGYEKSIKKVIEKGIIQGIEKGINQSTILLIKNMLKEIIDIEQIS